MPKEPDRERNREDLDDRARQRERNLNEPGTGRVSTPGESVERPPHDEPKKK